ncbi:short chain dehydrogenase [Hypoxylon sp. NC1633]|nr:short chain dehydrogenase [Hypoxylon sp. NC1633]
MAKYNKLAGKHVLVIGGSNGIGRGVVEASLEAGARVTLVGSSESSANRSVSQIQAAYPGAQVTGLWCDLSRATVEQDLDALFVQAKAKAEGGEIDHVVYTAGDRLQQVPVQDISLAKFQEVAHFRGAVPALVGKLVKRHLAPSCDRSLTLTTGGIAYRPAMGWTITAFMGAGQIGLMQNLALELKPLRVNIVAPGFVDTGLWDGMGEEAKAKAIKHFADTLPTGRAGDVVDVAEAYVYLMKDRNATGEVVKTRGGHNLI